MRILFLSHYFPPEVNAPATRTFEHCKHWASMGHNVTVVCCVPNHPMGVIFPGHKNRLFQVENIHGIKVVRVLTYITPNSRFFRRTVNYLLYMLMAVLVAPFLARVDVVVSTSPQFFNGLAGYFVSRIKGVPWVLEVRDLWPESIVAVGAMNRNGLLVRVLEHLERFVYRKASHIVSVTQSFKLHISERGGEEVSVLRNGVDVDLFSPREKDIEFAKKINVHKKFVVAYVGTHGMAHGLEILIEAAISLRCRQDILFLTAGQGAQFSELKNAVASEGLDNIVMLGQQPKEVMPQLWSVADVSLVLLRNLELFNSVIPSKIFESMAMCKPIILGVKGEAASIIDEAGAGICIEPGNCAELVDAIKSLASDRNLCREYGNSACDYVRDKFDRRFLAERYISVLEEVVVSG